MPNWTQWTLPLSLVFFSALLGSLIFKKIKKPNIIVFILLGLFFGNFVSIPFLNKELLEPLASLGVVLLLFTIGLELPVQRLIRSSKYLLWGSVMQIICTSLAIFLALFIFTGNALMALLVSLPLSMSSTAIVSRLLEASGEDSSLTGELTVGVLIAQDLFSIFLITFFTLLIQTKGLFNLTFVFEFLKVGVLGAGVYFLLATLLKKAFEITKFSREELSLLTFAALFGALWLFSLLNIPETTAGFVLGLLLSRETEQYEIFSQVKTFRDILLVLFFFFLGTFIQKLTLPLLVGALAVSLVLMFIKFLAVFAIFSFLKFHKKTAFWVAFDLMQLGEFSFVVLAILGKGGSINNDQYQFFLLVVVWSLLLFALIYRRKLNFYAFLDKYLLSKLSFFHRLSQANVHKEFDVLPYSDHIVLCGYGRMGSYIGHGLLLSQIPLIVIDTDANNIKKLAEKGVKAMYGDAAEYDMLDFAQVEKAKFLIITVPNPLEQEQIIFNAKRMNPKIRILTRAHISNHLRHLKTLGISYIYQPEFEAAISILKRILKLYEFEKGEITKKISYLKMEHGMV